jgi:hypothetical protein
MTRVGSAVSTVLGLASVGMMLVFLEVLRLVLCRFGAGSGVLLLGYSENLIISLLPPSWELDIFVEMLT